MLFYTHSLCFSSLSTCGSDSGWRSWEVVAWNRAWSPSKVLKATIRSWKFSDFFVKPRQLWQLFFDTCYIFLETPILGDFDVPLPTGPWAWANHEIGNMTRAWCIHNHVLPSVESTDDRRPRISRGRQGKAVSCAVTNGTNLQTCKAH